MASVCVSWGHAQAFTGSRGECDKNHTNFEVISTSPRSFLPRGALTVDQDVTNRDLVRRYRERERRESGEGEPHGEPGRSDASKDHSRKSADF